MYSHLEQITRVLLIFHIVTTIGVGLSSSPFHLSLDSNSFSSPWLPCIHLITERMNIARRSCASQTVFLQKCNVASIFLIDGCLLQHVCTLLHFQEKSSVAIVPTATVTDKNSAQLEPFVRRPMVRLLWSFVVQN